MNVQDAEARNHFHSIGLIIDAINAISPCARLYSAPILRCRGSVPDSGRLSFSTLFRMQTSQEARPILPAPTTA